MSAIWTPERIEEGRRLRGERKSAGEVAEILGGVTREEVIAKIWRQRPSTRKRPGATLETSTTRSVVSKAKSLEQSPPSHLALRRFTWEPDAR